MPTAAHATTKKTIADGMARKRTKRMAIAPHTKMGTPKPKTATRVKFFLNNTVSGTGSGGGERDGGAERLCLERLG